jgi:hypothetical protein
MTVKAFDSAEEMLAEMQRDREDADAHIEEWQRPTKPGDKIVRLADVFGEILLIYGKLTEPEPVYGAEWRRTSRYGWFYSVACPEGEPGSLHLATITAVITDEEFEAAREAGWPMDLNLVRNAVQRRSGN